MLGTWRCFTSFRSDPVFSSFGDENVGVGKIGTGFRDFVVELKNVEVEFGVRGQVPLFALHYAIHNGFADERDLAELVRDIL